MSGGQRGGEEGSLFLRRQTKEILEESERRRERERERKGERERERARARARERQSFITNYSIMGLPGRRMQSQALDHHIQYLV